MISITTGFGPDQRHTISDDEAHKAYYLFLHPESRGIFDNGLALIGKNITSVEPDYRATMGWHASHKLDGDDWEDISAKGVDRKLADVMTRAKLVAHLAEKEPELINQKLSEIKTLSAGSGMYSPRSMTDTL